MKAILKDLGEVDPMDVILCIGDGKTDEVIFTMLHEDSHAITCTVGKKQTEGRCCMIVDRSDEKCVAKYYLDSVNEVESLLQALV